MTKDDKLSIADITKTVVAVQQQALDLAEYDIVTGVNIYARNTLRLLHSLGANKDQLTNLVNELYLEEENPLDDGIADACISIFTMAYMLSTDLQIAVYQRLCEVINSPREHRYNNTNIFEVAL